MFFFFFELLIDPPASTSFWVVAKRGFDGLKDMEGLRNIVIEWHLLWIATSKDGECRYEYKRHD